MIELAWVCKFLWNLIWVAFEVHYLFRFNSTDQRCYCLLVFSVMLWAFIIFGYYHSDYQNHMYYILMCLNLIFGFWDFLASTALSSVRSMLLTHFIQNLFSGHRLNKSPPNLTFRKKDKGGINLTSTVTNTHLDLDTVKAICSEYRIHNADITLRYDATADDLIDVIEGSRVYMPCIYVVNKIDQITLEELEILDKLPHYCPIR